MFLVSLVVILVVFGNVVRLEAPDGPLNTLQRHSQTCSQTRFQPHFQRDPTGGAWGSENARHVCVVLCLGVCWGVCLVVCLECVWSVFAGPSGASPRNPQAPDGSPNTLPNTLPNSIKRHSQTGNIPEHAPNTRPNSLKTRFQTDYINYLPKQSPKDISELTTKLTTKLTFLFPGFARVNRLQAMTIILVV